MITNKFHVDVSPKFIPTVHIPHLLTTSGEICSQLNHIVAPHRLSLVPNVLGQMFLELREGIIIKPIV